MKKQFEIFLFICTSLSIVFLLSQNVLNAENKINSEYDKFNIGDVFGSYNYYNDIDFYNKLNINFKLGSSSNLINSNLLKEIFPGNWLVDVSFMLYVDKKMNYVLVNYEENQKGVIVDAGIVKFENKEIIFKSRYVNEQRCLIKQFEYVKGRNKKYNEFIVDIFFSKMYFNSSCQVDGIQARILLP